MIYNIAIIDNKLHFQTQLKKCCRMIYNITIIAFPNFRWIPPGFHGLHLDSIWIPWSPPGVHGITTKIKKCVGFHLDSTWSPWFHVENVDSTWIPPGIYGGV
jgi:hypothetical protein